METDVRPCICGRLVDLDRAARYTRECLCGVALFIQPDGDGWFIQHGPNPEHRSPTYVGDNLLDACDWIDAVCLHDREPEVGE